MPALRLDAAVELPVTPYLPSPLIVIYGDVKVGKSTLMAETYPLSLFICRPGGMLSFFSFLGLSAQYGLRPLERRNTAGQPWVAYAFEHHVKSLPEVPPILPVAEQLGFPAVCVDDMSLGANAHDRHVRQPRAEGGLGITSFKRFDVVGGPVAATTELARYGLLPVCLTTHMRPPEEVPSITGGKEIAKGSPKFPARNLADGLVAEADLVIYMARDPAQAGFGAVFDMRNANYRAGDRLDCLPIYGPANLRGPLVHRGYHLPRYPGLEWQDAVMVHVADRLDRGDDFAVVHQEVAAACLAAGAAVPHVKWALRDGRGLAAARARERASLFDDFFRASPASVAAASPLVLQATPPVTVGTKEDDD